MVAEVALHAGLDPTVSVGGHMLNGGKNYRVGDSKCFVLESCEYSNQFSHWHPYIGIILNIDADHLDFFGSMENLIAAFGKFAANIRPEGALIIQAGIRGFEAVTCGLGCEVITFGLTDGARFRAENIVYNEGKPSFDVTDEGKFLARVNLSLVGEYNMLNALACFAAASRLGISAEKIAAALNGAKGTKRRFEYKGKVNGAKIIDDYAHHPTEIMSCLKAARETFASLTAPIAARETFAPLTAPIAARETLAPLAAPGKIYCLFQPHTYTRTKNLLHDFAKSFSDADKIILLPIYAAREPHDPLISSEILAKCIKSNGDDVIFIENFAKAGNYLRETLRKGDMLITMGAGDVYEVGDILLHAELSTLSTECDE
jgi:UDP-N-acetylmuramate--alanine ligase